jgi:hypothetical protein
MQNISSSLSREQLGFAQTVNAEFSFLIHDYNMKCVRTEPTLIRYESNCIFIEVYHESNSYELGIEVGLIPSSNERTSSYGLGDVLETVLGKEHNLTTFYQSSTVDGVKQSVNDLAKIVRQYYGPLLSGDKDVFKQLELVSNQRSEELMRDRMAKSVREKAARAWENKDYKGLIELYQSIKPDLTVSELKKLEYARKQL